MSSAPVLAKKSDPAVAPSTSSSLFMAPQKRTFVGSLLLIVFTLAIYNQATHFSFVNYDDPRYVFENVHVRGGLSWATVRWALTSLSEANWHPLTWISHALDCQLFQLNPAGHHFTSILLHALNGVLLFLLLARATRRTGPSFFVALLFLLHPFNVESVAWIAERKNVLSTMFLFLTLGAYGWYAMKPGWRRYSAVLILLACGLASKPMLVTAPFVLLLLDYWPLGRIRGFTQPSEALAVQQASPLTLVLEKVPLILMVVASSVVTMRAQRAGGALGIAPPIFDRLKNAIWSYGVYLTKTVWPTKLTLFYPYAGHSLSLSRVAIAAIVLIAISCVVFKFRSRGYLVTGWLWFLGTLVPVIGLVQVGTQAMADRYAYVPLIGIFVAITWLAADLAHKKQVSIGLQVVPAACIVVALSVICSRQISYWRDSITVWTHTLEFTQHNYMAEDNLGEALVHLHRIDEAYRLFVQASQDNPIDAAARLNIGTYLYQHGRAPEAIEQYKIAINLVGEPSLLAMSYANMGSAYTVLRDFENARLSFEHSLGIDPYQVIALQGMGFMLLEQGKREESIPYFQRFAELRPSSESYMQLSKVLEATNHHSEASAAYNHAMRLSQELPPVQQNTPQPPNHN